MWPCILVYERPLIIASFEQVMDVDEHGRVIVEFVPRSRLNVGYPSAAGFFTGRPIRTGRRAETFQSHPPTVQSESRERRLVSKHRLKNRVTDEDLFKCVAPQPSFCIPP